jgi:tetratricopeptide (TPR) repeat protein
MFNAACSNINPPPRMSPAQEAEPRSRHFLPAIPVQEIIPSAPSLGQELSSTPHEQEGQYSIMKTRNFHRINVPMAIAASVAAALLAGPAAFADENEDVSKLYKQGSLSKALERADAYLASHPRDAQMRFQKGLILTEQNETDDAIKIFSALSEDYPELPEPYNNLAVLYASQGDYAKAKTALEMAMRTHPSYSTAHVNLGDIYAKMASQAYGKALQLDKENTTAQTKLAMIKDLFTPGRSRESQTALAMSGGGAAPAVTEEITDKAPKKVAKKVPEKIPEKVPEKSSGNAFGKTAEKTREQQAPGKPTLAEKPAPEKPAPADDSDKVLEVLETVSSWAKAWSDKDAARYLGFYSSNFHPPHGTSRAAWENLRKERIDKPKSIHVSIIHPTVSFKDARHARIRFKQLYHSDNLKKVMTSKTLEMVKVGEKWLIQQESASK